MHEVPMRTGAQPVGPLRIVLLAHELAVCDHAAVAALLRLPRSRGEQGLRCRAVGVTHGVCASQGLGCSARPERKPTSSRGVLAADVQLKIDVKVWIVYQRGRLADHDVSDHDSLPKPADVSSAVPEYGHKGSICTFGTLFRSRAETDRLCDCIAKSALLGRHTAHFNTLPTAHQQALGGGH